MDSVAQEIPPLPESTILLVEVGSTAHGTGLPGGEDHDEMGVVVEDAAVVLGLDDQGLRTLMQRTQPEGSRSGPGDTDRTLHSLRRFLRLAASGNPSILMALWAPVLHLTPAGEELRALADAFVGRHVIPRYRGYMQAQTLRLLGLRGGGHGRRGGGGREELIAAHGYDTKYAMHAARLGFQCVELLTTRQLQLPIGGEPAEWLRAVRRGKWRSRSGGIGVWPLTPNSSEWQRMIHCQLERTGSGSPSGPYRPTWRCGHWRHGPNRRLTMLDRGQTILAVARFSASAADSSESSPATITSSGSPSLSAAARWTASYPRSA